MNVHRKPVAVAVALALIAAPSAVFAQQAAEAKKPDDGKPHLETINVSAERVTGFKAKTSQIGAFRDAELLDIPMTINVIPRTVLDAQDAQGLYDALKNTAGVARSQTSGTVADNLSIRGVATENRTSFRLNGGLPVNNLVEMPMENKERVEVLKGSSALYYGFTSPAGVVNMVTKRARTEPITTFALSGNDSGQYIGHLDVGRQFGDIGVRMNLAGGQVRVPIDHYEGTRQLVAGAFDWRVTEQLSIKADFENIRRSAVEQASVSILPAVNNAIVVPAPPDPEKLISGPWALTSGRIANHQIRADYYLNPDWAVMYEFGRAETDRYRRASSQIQNYNVLTGAGTLRIALTRGQSYANKNDRAELAGRVQTWIFDHDMTFGWMENGRYQNGPGQQVINVAQNLYNPVSIAEPLLTQTLALSPQDISDRGLYFYDRIRMFGDRLQIQLGVRKTDYVNRSAGGVSSIEETTPAYGLVFKPRKDTSLYVSYIEGLEEGGTAPLSTNNPGQVLPAGKSEQKEAGIRTEAIAGLSLTLAYFTIERASAYTNAANFFVLDGRTVYKGWEYSATGEIGKQFSIYLSGMFLDAKQEQAQNAALLGRAPDNTPEQTHSLFAEYRPAFVPGFALNGGAYYIGRRFINNLEQGSIPAYTIFTAGARYSTRIMRKNTSFQLNVENVADKRYWSAAGGGILAVGLPRQLKMSMKVEL